jgi:hypothetical protein
MVNADCINFYTADFVKQSSLKPVEIFMSTYTMKEMRERYTKFTRNKNKMATMIKNNEAKLKMELIKNDP